MVTNVTSLLKTVKAVEDEHTRGTRALESTIEVIGQEIRVYLYILRLLWYNFLITTQKIPTLRDDFTQILFGLCFLKLIIF